MIHALEHAVADGTIPRDRAALIFTDGDDRPAQRLTYGELVDGVTRVAVGVADAVGPGERVLVSCSPGPDFVRSFLGVLRARRVAVPTFPPGSLDDARNREHLPAVARQSGAAACITDESFDPAGPTRRTAGNPGELLPPSLEFAPDDDPAIRAGLAADAGDPSGGARTPAFVMFTSGTTDRRARGVVISHDALIANIDTIDRTFPGMAGATTVTWLPPHHDMGLVGGLLAPLHLGSTVVAMAPKVFVRRPAAWLEAIATHGAVLSAAPNFAYDLCVRRVSDAEAVSLDLGSWRHAVTGSEPVRATTMRAFTERFASSGFGPRTFRPSYGLAESTLLVSAGTWDAARADVGDPAVSCGSPPAGVGVCIVDLETGAPVPDGTQGEILVAGPSIGDGYLHDPARTEATFGATIPGRPGHFLRTGDLGRLADGELQVTGRRAALLRVRGKDYSAEAAETAAKDALRSVRACVATLITTPDGPRTCLVCEAADGLTRDDTAALTEAVAAASGLWLDEVVVVAKGALPKTSSGKVRRAEVQALLDE